MYKLFLIPILIFVKDSSANEIEVIAGSSCKVMSASEATSIQFKETGLTNTDPDTTTTITCPLTINSQYANYDRNQTLQNVRLISQSISDQQAILECSLTEYMGQDAQNSYAQEIPIEPGDSAVLTWNEIRISSGSSVFSIQCYLPSDILIASLWMDTKKDKTDYCEQADTAHMTQVLRSDNLKVSESTAAAFTLKLLKNTGENQFSNLGYECNECSFQQFDAIIPPPGWSKSPKQLILPNGEVECPLRVDGVPSTLDFIPEIPGDEFELIARQLDGELIEMSYDVLMIKATVMRNTRLRFTSGNRVHELTDTKGDAYVLFAYEVESIDFDRSYFENIEAMSNYPYPLGWSYSTRILDEELVLDSAGVVTVLSIRADHSTVWEKR